MTYYSFPEWVTFCERQGLDADGRGFQAMAMDLWDRAFDQEEEGQAWFAAKQADLAWQVGQLSPLSMQDLLQTGCELVLQHCRGQNRDRGNSLQEMGDGSANFQGGAEATLQLELVANLPSPQVRFKSVQTGNYLRLLEAKDPDFRAAGPAAEGTIFEVMPRDAVDSIHITLASKLGPVLGTFLPRKAPEAAAVEEDMADAEEDNMEMGWAEWLEFEKKQLCAEARGLMEADPGLQGRRHWKKDPLGNCYSFEEWVAYVHGQGWGGYVEDGVMILAKEIWRHSSEVQPVPTEAVQEEQPVPAEVVQESDDAAIDAAPAEDWQIVEKGSESEMQA